MKNEYKSENKTKYYVIYKNNDLDNEIEVAQIDPQTHCFYDYHYLEDVENYDDFQLGNTVVLRDDGILELADSSSNAEVIEIIAEDNDFYKKLNDKYGSQLESTGHLQGTAMSILSDYIKDRIKNNQPVDLYVYDIVRILSSAMGLRLNWEHYGSLYNQISPFTYPEELYEVLSTMYNIISEKLANNESMRFLLYEYGGINKEYAEFLDEIERRTRYHANSFGSDLYDRIHSEAQHGKNWGYSETRRRLTNMKPLVTINPMFTEYRHDMASDTALVESTSPEEAEKRFGYMLGKVNNSGDESNSNSGSHFRK